MKNLKYISVYNIIAGLYRDLGIENINESDIIEWSADALDHIGSVEYSQLSTAFVEVNNFKCAIPEGCTELLQIVRRNGLPPANIQEILDECSCINKPGIELEVQSEQPQGERLDACGQPVILDCYGMPLEDYELAYYRPYFDYVYWYFGNNQIRFQQWTPVKLAQHNFFNSVKTNPELELYKNRTHDEYNIIDNVIHFSFDKGYVAISHYKRIYDKEGYPLIPDEVSILTAIKEYCTYKYFQKLWYQGREGTADKWKAAEQNWNWYCRQAKSKAKSLSAEQLNQLTNYMTVMLPRNNYWSSLMKSYGLPENVKYVKNTVYNGRRARQIF